MSLTSGRENAYVCITELANMQTHTNIPLWVCGYDSVIQLLFCLNIFFVHGLERASCVAKNVNQGFWQRL